MQHLKIIITVSIISVLIFICHGACSSSKTGKINSEDGLNMRTGPSTSYNKITTIPYATMVQLDCWKEGQSINGDDQWLKVCYGSYDGYVADYYVSCGGYCSVVHNLPTCGSSSSSSGSTLTTQKLSCPVKASMTLTGPFGDGRNHKGIDVSNSQKENVYAVMSGEVTDVVTGLKRYDKGTSPYTNYGNIVYIKHTGGVQTRYTHLDKVYVKIGDTVDAGERIALIGNSGDARGTTGIHLHFEWRVDGQPVDPCQKLSSVCSFC